MTLVMLIAGIVLILATIIAIVVSVSKTPHNLRGFYGVKYAVIGTVGIIGGIALAVIALLL